jgi:hypothetical protein
LPTIRCRESLTLSRREQVAALASKRQKPPVGLCVRFDASVVQDVANHEAALREAARDQKATMAFQRLAFRAHQADARALRLRRQSS